MAYKELVKRKRELPQNAQAVTREVALHIGYFIGGLLVSKGAVLGEMSPFGASFAAAVPFMYMPAGLFGSILGFLMRNPIDSFRCIAVIISIGALRWVLNEFKKVSCSRYFPCVVAFVPVFVTGVALTFSSASELSQVSQCLIEATLSAAGAYFMSRSVTLCSSNKSLLSLSPQELACIAMSGCILLLSFSTLTIGEVSVGRIVAVMVILLCARYMGVSGGTIAGVATGIVFSLSSNELIFLCAGFAFSGLMGGLFAPVSKFAVALCALVCNLTMSFSSNNSEIIFAIFVETVVASTVFMLLPKTIGNYISNVFSDTRTSNNDDIIRRAVTMRLSFASKALSNVSSCVNAVSNKLSRLYNQNAQWIYDSASERVCSRCGMRYYCFTKQKQTTYDDFNSLTDILKRNGFVKERDIEENFSKKCCRVNELVSAINQSYKEYLSCEDANRRITQIRSAVAGQFSGLSDILQDMSEEFENCVTYDGECSARVIDALNSLSLSVVDCNCTVSLGKGMVVEIQLLLNHKTNISRSLVTKEVSRACGRIFEAPQISYELDRVRVTLCEKAQFDVEIGTAQHVCNDAQLCGDCLNYFNNGMGSFVALLSDGMGTGGRAAVDSNMAVSIMSKLCRAGLSYDCALQVVNSSLMIKSEDESMATLDVLDFNTYSGKAELLKAGACVTYIKKNSKLYKKDMSSLPLGILNEVKFMKESISLTSDDMVVMVSDGALVGDDKWIEKLIMTCGDTSMQELSFSIVEKAKNRRNDGHDDDITAIAMRIVEN